MNTPDLISSHDHRHDSSLGHGLYASSSSRHTPEVATSPNGIFKATYTGGLPDHLDRLSPSRLDEIKTRSPSDKMRDHGGRREYSSPSSPQTSSIFEKMDSFFDTSADAVKQHVSSRISSSSRTTATATAAVNDSSNDKGQSMRLQFIRSAQNPSGLARTRVDSSGIPTPPPPAMPPMPPPPPPPMPPSSSSSSSTHLDSQHRTEVFRSSPVTHSVSRTRNSPTQNYVTSTVTRKESSVLDESGQRVRSDQSTDFDSLRNTAHHRQRSDINQTAPQPPKALSPEVSRQAFDFSRENKRHIREQLLILTTS